MSFIMDPNNILILIKSFAYYTGLFISIGAGFYFITSKYGPQPKPKKLLPLEDFISCTLQNKQIISHDTIQLTFALPIEYTTYTLGLPIGQHICLRYTDNDTKIVHQRSYTPVSDRYCVGTFTLVLKVYKPNPPKFPNGGMMSQHLDSLQIGDIISMKGPKGHIHYHDNGKITVKPLGKPLENRICQQICMIAGGTGITPMLQILHAIFHKEHYEQNKNIHIKLLYANQTEDDILVRNELELLHKEYPNRISIWYTIDKVDNKNENTWKYNIGFINKDVIEKHLLFNDTNQNIPTQFFICGPPPMIKFACIPALTELGYNDKNWIIF